MTTPRPEFSEPEDAPERLLAAPLRTTTPEFEARFDQLQRQLAAESPPRRAAPHWLSFLTGRRAPWLALGLGAAAAALVLMLERPRSAPPAPAGTANVAALAEAFTLDDSLRPALPLTDPETLDALLLIPIDQGGPS